MSEFSESDGSGQQFQSSRVYLLTCPCSNDGMPTQSRLRFEAPQRNLAKPLSELFACNEGILSVLHKRRQQRANVPTLFPNGATLC